MKDPLAATQVKITYSSASFVFTTANTVQTSSSPLLSILSSYMSYFSIPIDCIETKNDR